MQITKSVSRGTMYYDEDRNDYYDDEVDVTIDIPTEEIENTIDEIVTSYYFESKDIKKVHKFLTDLDLYDTLEEVYDYEIKDRLSDYDVDLDDYDEY